MPQTTITLTVFYTSLDWFCSSSPLPRYNDDDYADSDYYIRHHNSFFLSILYMSSVHSLAALNTTFHTHPFTLWHHLSKHWYTRTSVDVLCDFPFLLLVTIRLPQIHSRNDSMTPLWSGAMLSNHRSLSYVLCRPSVLLYISIFGLSDNVRFSPTFSIDIIIPIRSIWYLVAKSPCRWNNYIINKTQYSPLQKVILANNVLSSCYLISTPCSSETC